MRSSLVALSLLALAPVLARADDPPAEEVARSADALAARWAAVRAAVEAELGAALDPAPAFVPGTRAELKALIARENVDLLANVEGLPEGDALREACEAEADLLSRLCFAKVRVASGDVLVVGETFRFASQVAPELAGIAERAFLEVVLVHEAVHVWQHRRADLRAFLGQPPTIDALRARMAVIEGHAQHVTRRVAATLGLSEAFDLLVRVNTQVPSTAPAPLPPEAKALMEAVGIIYIDGERFVTAVIDRLGRDAALERLFADPPGGPGAVTNPDAYLGAAVDLGAILQKARPDLPPRWRRQSVPVTADLLRPALEKAGPEALAWLETGFREALAAAATDPAVPGRQVTVSLIRCASAAAALKLLEVEVAAARAYDEELKRPGAFATIMRADYGDAGLEGHRGHYIDKAVKTDGTVVVRTLAVARGEFVVEVLTVHHPALEKAQLQALARAVLDLLPEPR